MAATTLIDSTVMVTSRHTDSEATASEAASAFDSRADAMRADRSPKPIPETGDRSMVVNPQNGQRITPSQKSQESLSTLRRGTRQTWRKRGKLIKISRLCPLSRPGFGVQASAVRPVSVPGAVSGAVTSAGFHAIETNFGSLSTRFSQAFTDG